MIKMVECDIIPACVKDMAKFAAMPKMAGERDATYTGIKAACDKLKELMATGMPIDNIVFNTVLAACAADKSALSQMHELCDEMLAVQKKFPEPPTVDIVSYNTVMKALARHGDVEACFSLL